MKVEVNDKGSIVLKEVYAGLTLETADGETMGICMRDSGFEFNYQGNLYSAQGGVLKPIGRQHVEPRLQQVWYSKERRRKFVLLDEYEVSMVKSEPDKFIFIADVPHSEDNNEYGGIYSYPCGSPYCQCTC